MPQQRNHQISVRIPIELDRWLEKRAKQSMHCKADVVRTLIEDSMAKELEEQLLETFNEAARDLTTADQQERDLIAGSFIGTERVEE